MIAECGFRIADWKKPLDLGTRNADCGLEKTGMRIVEGK
jgi:hypothetical protein